MNWCVARTAGWLRHAGGWQAALFNQDGLAWRLADAREQAQEAGRGAQSKRYLDIYDTADYTREAVKQFGALGTPEQVVEHLKRIEQLGFDEVALRIASWNQREQMERLIAEVAPHFEVA